MPPGQQVTFQPALQSMLGKHFQHSTIGAKLTTVLVLGQVVSQPQLLAHFINGIKFVGGIFIWAEDPKVVPVQTHDIA